MNRSKQRILDVTYLMSVAALVIISLLVLTSAHAADIRCAKYDGGLWPVSKDAIQLARQLNVTKCDGKKYDAALKILGEKMENVGDASAEVIEVIEKARSEKREKQVKKKLKNFSF